LTNNQDLAAQEAAIRAAVLMDIDEMTNEELTMGVTLERDGSGSPTAIATPEERFELRPNQDNTMRVAFRGEVLPETQLFGRESYLPGTYIMDCSIDNLREVEEQIGSYTILLMVDCSFSDNNGQERMVQIPLAVSQNSQLLVIGWNEPQSIGTTPTGYFASEMLRQTVHIEPGSHIEVSFGLPNPSNLGLLGARFMEALINQTMTTTEISTFRETGDPSTLSDRTLYPLYISWQYLS
jgi:hypothetical protein